MTGPQLAISIFMPNHYLFDKKSNFKIKLRKDNY